MSLSDELYARSLTPNDLTPAPGVLVHDLESEVLGKGAGGD